MKINTTEKYEELAAEWQYQMLAILKDTLMKHKVVKELAKEISGDFAFDLAMLQDQGEIRVNGEEFRPVICFDNLEGELHFNTDDQFQLHDYAYGNNSELFDND